MNLTGRNTSPPHFDISSILRQSERLSVTLPCRVRTDGFDYQKAEAGTIVSRNVSTGQDEAAVIVVVPSDDAPSGVRIPYFIPITATFRHRLNQTPPSPSTSFLYQSARPHITLTLENGSDKVDLRISATQTVKVQTLIADLRQLLDLSRRQNFTKVLSHKWMEYYPLKKPLLDVDAQREQGDVETPRETSTSSIVTPPTSSSSVTSLVPPLEATTLSSPDVAVEDQEFPNPFAPGFDRVQFQRKRIFARQDQWSSQTPVRARLCTFNVNDKLPPPGTTELAPVVGAGEEDLLVFGLQEMDLRSQALLVSQGNVRADEWEAAIVRGLGPKAEDFEKIAMTQYVGVMTLVFVRKSLRPAVSRIETSERGIGLLGFGGNKAGVAVRLRIHDTTVAFVNSHLAAFATAIDRRRADFQVLLRGLPFPSPVGEDVVPAFEEFYPDVPGRVLGVDDSHVMFWMGDLNYRVDMEEDILRAWVEEGKWKSILEKDQLRGDIASGKSFAGFNEHDIDFAPSFKYIHGSTTFDTRRSPAYTDRILWSVPSGLPQTSKPAVECDDYNLHNILWSDHRPVSGSYSVNVRVVDEVKRREAYVGVERELEKLEEIYRPALDVSETSIDFGDIKCLRKHVRELRLTNNGRVPASFSFKPPAADKPICKPWFWPFPSNGTVQPGETATMQITLFVDETQAGNLSVGNTELNDVLVLRIAEGKELFVTVQATFQPTILSLPLSLVNRLPRPIRELTLVERKDLANPPEDAYEDKPKGVKPVKEIWRLLEYLMLHGGGVPALWTRSSSLDSTLDVLEGLDTGTDVAGQSQDAEAEGDRAVSVAACLLLLLSSLPVALIPESRARVCEMSRDRDDAFASLEGLDQVQTNVLIGLMSVVKLCLETVASPVPSPISKDGDATQPDQTPNTPPSSSTPSGAAEGRSTPPPPLSKEDIVVPAGLGSPIGELPTPMATPAKEEKEAVMDAAEVVVQVTEPTPKKNPPAALGDTSSTEAQADTLESVVEVLLPAVFGSKLGAAKQMDGKRKFIRLLLEG